MPNKADPPGAGAVAKENSQVSYLPSSRKRGAIRSPPDATWVHRTKFTRNQIIPPPRSSLRPAALPHIKWHGINEQPEPTGDKCLICKRDLIFSPEGSVVRPPIPPPVAVLHCGHTFHDHCLQKITPEDQRKSPPCIPCAIREN